MNLARAAALKLRTGGTFAATRRCLQAVADSPRAQRGSELRTTVAKLDAKTIRELAVELKESLRFADARWLLERSLAEGMQHHEREFLESCLGSCRDGGIAAWRAAHDAFLPAMEKSGVGLERTHLILLVRIATSVLREGAATANIDAVSTHYDERGCWLSRKDRPAPPVVRALLPIESELDATLVRIGESGTQLPVRVTERLVEALCAGGAWEKALEVSEMLLEGESGGPDSRLWPLYIEGCGLSNDVQRAEELFCVVESLGPPEEEDDLDGSVRSNYEASHFAMAAVFERVGQTRKAARLRGKMRRGGMAAKTAVGGKKQQRRARRGGQMRKQLFVPEESVGTLIGKGGESIASMQSESGANINISPREKEGNGGSARGAGVRCVVVRGDQDAVMSAQRIISLKLEWWQGKKDGRGR